MRGQEFGRQCVTSPGSFLLNCIWLVMEDNICLIWHCTYVQDLGCALHNWCWVHCRVCVWHGSRVSSQSAAECGCQLVCCANLAIEWAWCRCALLLISAAGNKENKETADPTCSLVSARVQARVQVEPPGFCQDAN